MAAKKKKFVPEKHFQEVPESFSAESNIVGVDSRVNTNGIILNSLKEVELALRLHNGEMSIVAESSLSTKWNLANDLLKSSGPVVAGLLFSADEILSKGKDFVGTMMAEAKCHLAKKGKYARYFDYDGMGSNFLKTRVSIIQVEDKFVLSISGSTVESDLSLILGRAIALSSVDIEVFMSVVDDWWYNLNLKKVLGDIGYFDPEMEQTWPQLAKVLADENHQFWISILKDGVPLALSFRVDYSTYRYLSEQGERKGIDLTKASDGNVAGAAWNCYRHDYEEAVGEKKRLKISVVFDGVNYSSPPIIDSQKTEALTTVAMEIEKRLLEKVAA